MESPRGDKRLQVIALTEWRNHKESSISSPPNGHTMSPHGQESKSKELHLLETLSPIMSQNEITSTSTIKDNEMARKDSGWSESTHVQSSQPSSRRTSTSASVSRRNSLSRPSRKNHRTTNSSSSTRPSTRRASKSSPQTAQVRQRCPFTPPRPSLNSRHTIQNPTTPPHQTIPQLFHFPHFPSPEPPKETPPPVQQPPPTVNYWTSDRTRRMEYAAIDAASQGIRGFVTKLIPECMLSKEFRRTRFCKGDEGSDAGSVRRYRLDLPDEAEEDEEIKAKKQSERPSIFRKWSSGFKKTTA